MTQPFLFEWLDQTDSTNSEALRRAQANTLHQPLVLATDHQTAGRGRRGRHWVSKSDHSLCMSYVVRVPTAQGMPFASPNLAVVPVMCGFAVCRFFNSVGASVQMKWPNDVLAQHKKLAGMLCESVNHGDGILLVLGLGVNVLGGVDAPGALDGAGAIALEQILPTQHHAQLLNLPDLAQGLALQLHYALGLALREGLAPSLSQIHALDAWRHCPVQVRDNGLTLHTGTALGVDANGCYLIQEANGRIVPIVAGDLSLRLLTP